MSEIVESDKIGTQLRLWSADPTRMALLEACVMHNLAVLTGVDRLDKIDLSRLVPVPEVLERYDNGEPIAGLLP